MNSHISQTIENANSTIFVLPPTTAPSQGNSTLVPQLERKVLTYDGSNLGEFDFMSVVSWCHPCTEVTSGMKAVALFAVINLPGLIEPQHVILKRNCAGHTDQLVVDELKLVFSLHKMGTHAIRLRGILVNKTTIIRG